LPWFLFNQKCDEWPAACYEALAGENEYFARTCRHKTTALFNFKPSYTNWQGFQQRQYHTTPFKTVYKHADKICLVFYPSENRDAAGAFSKTNTFSWQKRSGHLPGKRSRFIGDLFSPLRSANSAVLFRWL
jgi:hypothetical protein